MPIRHQVAIIIILLIAYTLPVTMAFAFLAPNPMAGADTGIGYFKWFATFASDSESQLNLFHKIILPIVAGMSALSLSNDKIAAAQTEQTLQTDVRIWLILFCITFIVLAIARYMLMRIEQKSA